MLVSHLAIEPAFWFGELQIQLDPGTPNGPHIYGMILHNMILYNLP